MYGSPRSALLPWILISGLVHAAVVAVSPGVAVEGSVGAPGRTISVTIGGLGPPGEAARGGGAESNDRAGPEHAPIEPDGVVAQAIGAVSMPDDVAVAASQPPEVAEETPGPSAAAAMRAPAADLQATVSRRPPKPRPRPSVPPGALPRAVPVAGESAAPADAPAVSGPAARGQGDDGPTPAPLQAAAVGPPAPAATNGPIYLQTWPAPFSAAGGLDVAEPPRVSRGVLFSLLRQAIDSHKQYPLLARRQQREGATTVAFNLHPDGGVDTVSVVTTSGFTPLDRAAQRAVQKVAPFAPAGEYLSGVQRFKVTVEFRLR